MQTLNLPWKDGNAFEIATASKGKFSEVEVNRRLSEMRALGLVHRTFERRPSGSGNPSYVHSCLVANQEPSPAPQPAPAHHPAFQPIPQGPQGDLFNQPKQAA